MLVFGHLGIGLWLVKKSPSRLVGTTAVSKFSVFAGALLPDLIDKPVYYTLAWSLQKSGLEIGILGSTRTFGHTFLFFLILLSFSYLKKSPLLRGVALGVLSHFVLDFVIDPKAAVSVLWPTLGWQFPPVPFRAIHTHILSTLRPSVILCELLGLFLFIQEWKKRSEKAIIFN